MANLLNKHNDDSQQKQQIHKSEQNLQHAELGKPQKVYGGFNSKPKRKKQYASLRTDKTVICKLKALRNFYGDHNVGVTLDRMLKDELPKVLTDNKKKIFFDGLVNSYEKSIGDRSTK